METVKKIIETIDVNGNSIKLMIIKPTNKLLHEANLRYHQKTTELVKRGLDNPKERLLLRSEVDDYLIKNKIWTHADLLRIEQLAVDIKARELMIKRGGIKISDARLIAIEMNEMRNEILQIHSKRQQLDSATIESHAENYRFEFLLTKCVLTEDGRPCFKDYDDYIARNTENSSVDAAKALANIIYGLEENIKMSMFEMQWLKEANFIDDHGRYVNKKGQFTDKNGRLVNEDGKYINEKGELIDRSGRLIDIDGSILIDSSKPFIDDDTGKEIVLCGIGLNKVRNHRKKKNKLED